MNERDDIVAELIDKVYSAITDTVERTQFAETVRWLGLLARQAYEAGAAAEREAIAAWLDTQTDSTLGQAQSWARYVRARGEDGACRHCSTGCVACDPRFLPDANPPAKDEAQ